MANEETLQAAAAVLAPWTIGTKSPEANRLDVHINAADMLACVKALVPAHWGYLIASTALDPLGMTAPRRQGPRGGGGNGGGGPEGRSGVQIGRLVNLAGRRPFRPKAVRR